MGKHKTCKEIKKIKTSAVMCKAEHLEKAKFSIKIDDENLVKD